MIKGYKTYIFGSLAVLSVLLNLLGVIEYEVLMTLLGIFLPAEGMALRHAIKN